MREPIIIVFRHDDKIHSMVIRPEDADWWTSVDDFDVHYCEDYNQISIYKSDNNYVTIHKQKITINEEEQSISK